jgi:hypothetical protein
MDLEPCHYCGLIAETVDHVVPRALLIAVRNSGEVGLIAAVEERHRTMTVPSCRECNSLAGAVYDQTLEDRKRRVKGKLRQRLRKVLEMPDWTDRELMEVSPSLRNLVLAGIRDREIARRRIAH